MRGCENITAFCLGETDQIPEFIFELEGGNETDSVNCNLNQDTWSVNECRDSSIYSADEGEPLQMTFTCPENQCISWPNEDDAESKVFTCTNRGDWEEEQNVGFFPTCIGKFNNSLIPS